ncbi:MAG: acyl-CoA thioesterase [Firmicutes bacterium]|nr:acyl-CoA thioesterase [Bacillota bacterium]
MTDMLESRLSLIVRSTEIDINGHVNNAKYLEYLEWGREDWYEHAALPYDVLLALGVVTMTVNVNLNYRKEARQNDVLTVITRPERVGNTSFTVKQSIVREQDQAQIADGTVTLVTVDAIKRTSTPVPEVLRRLFMS